MASELAEQRPRTLGRPSRISGRTIPIAGCSGGHVDGSSGSGSFTAPSVPLGSPEDGPRCRPGRWAATRLSATGRSRRGLR